MFHDVVFVLFECLSACLSNVETVRASKRASKERHETRSKHDEAQANNNELTKT